MKTFTKICLLAMVMLMPAFLIAQESLTNFTGNTAPDKQEFIQQLHGPTPVVPPATAGGGKAIGDDCADPVVITVEDIELDLPYQSLGQTTAGRGNSYDNTCLNDFDGGEDMIYELILDFDITLTFELDPDGTPYTGFALNEQCYDNPTTTCLAVSTDTYGTGEAHGFAIALEAGTYYIIVDSWPLVKTSSIPNFNLTIAPTTPVPNDDCANAIEINEVNDLYFSTEEATVSAWPNDFPDIFYKYTATVTDDIIISLCDVYFDSHLSVYDACNGIQIASNDDGNCGQYSPDWSFGLGSIVPLTVTAGDEYIIRIRGFGGDTGFGFINIWVDDSGCDYDCPSGGTDELESCGTDINGGCNMATPAFTNVSSGDTICGNLWADNGERDTDWFEITISEISNIKLSVKGEESVIFGMVAQDEPGVAGCNNMYGYFAGSKQLPPCVEDSVEFGYLQPGTYYFMVASNEFYFHPCLGGGFEYQAAFTVQPSAHGTISGFVDDGITGIGGVKITADGYTAVTAGDGTYSIDVPSGTYDVYADGMDAGYSSDMSSGEVVTVSNTTTVDFTLDDGQPGLMVTGGYSNANLQWTPVSKKGFKGGDVVFGEINSDNDYFPGSTMDLEFTLVVFSPDEEDVEYMGIEFPSEFGLNSGSDINGVSPIITGQDIEWTGTLMEGSGAEISFTVSVTVSGGASGPLLADYFVESDMSGGQPHYFAGYVTIFEQGGTYVPTYNVYRKLDDGTGNVFIPLVKNIPDTELFDVIHAGDWCYFVTQNLESGFESAPSEIGCVEMLDPCEDAVDYGQPGDPPQTASIEYEEQVLWYTFTTPMADVQITTCGSNFDTQFAIYASCDDIPEYPDMVPVGAMEVATDGCEDLGQASAAFCSLDSATYYVAVYGENGQTGDVELDINYDVQCLTIMDGWGGFSTYIEPEPNDSIAVVLKEMEEEMIITVRQNPYGIWWVPENINTIGEISPVIGYKAKMNGTETTIVSGTEIADKTVTIPAGASYLPVRVPYPTDISDLATQLGPELLIIYNIYNAAEVYWPDGGLNLLPELLPDYAYQINVYNEVDFTYPTAKSSQPEAEPYQPAPFKGENMVWNDVVNTGNPHFISVDQDATDEIQIGDVIGVFNSDGLCVGFTEVESLEENLLVTAFGNDEYTEEMDGLEQGEMINFKLYRPSIDEEYAVEVAWDATMPNSNGLFATNGMSMITSFKVGSTDITESEFANVSIFPNPSAGVFNIEGLQSDAQVTVTNAQGQVIFTGDVSNNGLLDMSAQPKGVYFIRLINDEEMMIQKVILK